MDISYQRSPGVSHMLIKTLYAPSGFEETMIKENDIAHLLKYSRADTEEGLEYWFDISGRKSLRGYFAQEGINRTSVMHFLQELIKACNTIDKYLLNPDGLILGVETVFFRRENMSFVGEFAYIPEGEGDFLTQLLSVFEYIIQNVDHTDVDSVRVCYRLFEMIGRGEVTLEELLEVCGEDLNLSTEPKPEIVERQMEIQPVPEAEESEYEGIYYDDGIIDEEPKNKLKNIFSSLSVKLNNRPAPKSTPHESPKKKHWGRKKNQTPDYSQMEDFVMEPKIPAPEYAETAVLSPGTSRGASLIHEGPERRESILLNKPHFKIGSRRTGNDAVIQEDIISRCHATIDREGDEYYLEDMESRNGTYVNGNIIGYHQRVRLKSGDLISFANICYRFLQ